MRFVVLPVAATPGAIAMFPITQDTGSRQTGHDVVYFAAQPPQRMCPHGTIAVGLSFGSRQIGHSSESRAGAVGGGAATAAAGGAARAIDSIMIRVLQSSGGFRVARADATLMDPCG